MLVAWARCWSRVLRAALLATHLAQLQPQTTSVVGEELGCAAAVELTVNASDPHQVHLSFGACGVLLKLRECIQRQGIATATASDSLARSVADPVHSSAQDETFDENAAGTMLFHTTCTATERLELSLVA